MRFTIALELTREKENSTAIIKSNNEIYEIFSMSDNKSTQAYPILEQLKTLFYCFKIAI